MIFFMDAVDAGAGVSKVEAPKTSIKVPKPSEVGFRQIIGRDVLDKSPLDSAHEHLQRLANMKIDNTEERSSRWEGHLRNLAELSGDTQKRQAIIAELRTFAQSTQESSSQENAQDQIAVAEFTISMLTNINNPAVLKGIIARGARDTMQEAIAVGYNSVRGHYQAEGNSDAQRAVRYATELARELYVQEHDGRAYQTSEEKAALERATQDAARVIIK